MCPIALVIERAVLLGFSNNAIKVSYEALKEALKKKFSANHALITAVNELENNPNSEGRRVTLKEEVIHAKVDDNPEILKFVEDLLNKIKEQTGEQIISQTQNNTMSGVNVGGNIVYNPVSIGTQTVESSHRPELNKESPYKGLKKFLFEDKDNFFGRDNLIDKLFDAVERSSLSLVVGASGSGKSSLVLAGLIPKLKKSLNSQTFYDFIFTPDEDPFASLSRSLRSTEKNYSFSESEARIALEAKAETLAKVIQDLKKKKERWLIFVDQFEQLFTTCEDLDKRKNFIEGLIQITETGDGSVQIILAIRSDFLEQLSIYSNLFNIASRNNLHLVEKMQPTQLRQAIEQPALKHGVRFEEGLVRQIIEEVEGQKGYLPLLEHTLSLLWDRECETIGSDGSPNIERCTLTKASYTALEGVRGALQKQVNEIYSNDLVEQEATKKIFMQLVKVVDTDSGRRAVSRTAPLNKFVDESLKKIIAAFVKVNLLVINTERDNNSQSQREVGTVEIAHEILLSSWDALKGWIEEEEELIRKKYWLEGERKQWEKIYNSTDKSKADNELLTGSRLDEFDELREKDAFKNIGGLGSEEIKYIEASVKWRISQDENEKDKERKEELSRAASLGRSALSLLDNGEELDAFVEAIEAGKILKRHEESNPVVLNALKEALRRRSERNRLEGHKISVNSLSFSPDGRTLASGSSDKTIKLWNVDTGKLIHLPNPLTHSSYVNCVSFNSDGTILAAGDADNMIKLWNVVTGQEICFPNPLTHSSYVNSVSFGPESNILATGSADKTIKLWNVDTGELLHTFKGHKGEVNSVSFSPDENRKILASVSADGKTKLWNVDTGKLLHTFKGHKGEVNSVSFSHNGEMLVTCSADGKTKLWNLDNHREICTFEGHHGRIESISFSSDSKTLATGGADTTIKLWNVDKKTEVCTLKGHHSRINSVCFSSNENRNILATCSPDSKIKLWDLDKHLDNQKETHTLKGHGDHVKSISFSSSENILVSVSSDKMIKFWNVDPENIGTEYRTPLKQNSDINSISLSPDGKILAAGDADKMIKLWNVDTGQEKLTLKGHSNFVNSVSFSPGGEILAAGDADNMIKLWNVFTGEVIRTFEGHSGEVNSVSFSPDGKILAAGDADNMIKLWDVVTGEFKHAFKGHKDYVTSISFSPDRNRKILASVSADLMIKLWDVDKETEICTLKGHGGLVYSVSFSPDGKTLATSSADSTIKLWDIDFWIQDLDTLMEKACNWVKVYLQNNSNVSESDRHLCD